MAALIEREVLAKGRRALVIAGYGHLVRTGFSDGTLPAHLDARHPKALRIVLPIAPRGSHPIAKRLGNQPALIYPVQGTWLANLETSELLDIHGPSHSRLVFGGVADGYLHLGAADDPIAQAPALDPSRDRAYRQELERRRAIVLGSCVGMGAD
jgi:hypothetical protein